MASKNFTGYLRDPLGEYATFDKWTFTHITTTGETVAGCTSILNIGADGFYNIDIEYGQVNIRTKDTLNKNTINQGTYVINSETLVTTLPALLNAEVPVSDPVILEMEALLADAETAKDIAVAAAAQMTAVELINSADTYPLGTVLTLSGYSSPGDGGGAQWKFEGVTGQTPSQSPADLGDALINDASGNQWAIVALDDCVSVSALGAKGDGIENDAPVFEAAMRSVSKVICSACGAYLIQNCTIPYKQIVIDINGGSIITDGADSFIYTPYSSGEFYTQDVVNGNFTIKSNNTSLDMVQLWEASYKNGNTVKNNTFKITTDTLTVDNIINLLGQWAVNIHDNHFEGNYTGTSYTAIRFEPNDSLSSSVMNASIRRNKFLNLYTGIYQHDRTTPTGGRAESWSVTDNTFINTDGASVRDSECLLMQISDNVFSQNTISIQTNSSHSLITGNLIEGIDNDGILVEGQAGFIVENSAYTNNVFKLNNASRAMRFVTVKDNGIRAITATNNTFYGLVNDNSKSAIMFDGDFIYEAINCRENTGIWLADMFNTGNATDGNIIGRFDQQNTTLVTDLFNDKDKFSDVGSILQGRFLENANTATLNSEDYDVFSSRTTTTVTDVTPSTDGQFVTIINNSSGSKTIQNSGLIQLAGAVDFVMTPKSTLTLVQAATQWFETARMVR